MSGLFYWISRCEETSVFITPFSWALSAQERGFTTIATTGDIDCIHWLMDNEKQDDFTISDSNGAYLLRSWAIEPIVSKTFYNSDVRMSDNNTDSYNYILFTDWNTKHGEYIYCESVGLRLQYPYQMKNIDGELWLYGIPNYPILLIKEVFRSGNSIIYMVVK
jgi:hypothetical protein